MQKGSVLIVDDEPLIRLATAFHFQDEGFVVYEAESADVAIRLLEEHIEIRLVFTDINMPGSMDGLKLAHYVSGRWPPVKIIVTSGKYKPMADALPVGAMFFLKPYNTSKIVRKALELMAA